MSNGKHEAGDLLFPPGWSGTSVGGGGSSGVGVGGGSAGTSGGSGSSSGGGGGAGGNAAGTYMPELAHQFLGNCGITPTPDAVAQLVEVFLPCLHIMCERGYDEDGQTWQAHGWRGCLFLAKGKMERLWWRAWRHGRHHPDSAIDGINFLGFYLRSIKNDPWGNWGEPGDE